MGDFLSIAKELLDRFSLAILGGVVVLALLSRFFKLPRITVRKPKLSWHFFVAWGCLAFGFLTLFTMVRFPELWSKQELICYLPILCFVVLGGGWIIWERWH